MSNPVLCVFLLSCFTKNLTRTVFPDCPDACDCYSAPKNGKEPRSSWTREDGLSMVCEKFPSINQFDKLSKLSINTFGLINLTSERVNAINFLTEFSINNIVFSNSTLNDNALRTVININKTSLKVLTFIGIDFSGMQNVWNIFSAFRGLQALHIENSTITALDANFARLSSENILVANILNASLKLIDDNVFARWTKLRMLTISKNIIKDTYWLKSKMPDLWYLDLSHNEIAFLRNDLMVQMPKLKVLKLDFNKLMIISWQTMQPLVESLRELSFKGNLLCMNRETSWTLKEYDLASEYLVPQDPLFYTWSLSGFSCVYYMSDNNIYDKIYDNCLGIASESDRNYFREYTGDCFNYESNLLT